MQSRPLRRRSVRNLLARTLVPAGLCLIATGLVFLPGCDRAPARTGAGQGKKITVAVSSWLGSAPVYVAKEKGYFADEGLDATLQPIASGHLGLAAVLAGKADFATAAETPIARAALDGKPLAVVATIAETDGAIQIVARKDRGISTADDLRGKTIGVTAGTAGEFFLHIYLTTSHIDPRHVRIADVAADKVVHALQSGQVDAVSSWPPHTNAMAEGLGRNAVILQEPALYTMHWNIVAGRDLVRRDPDVVARLLRAIVRANRLIAERPAEARAITAGLSGNGPASVEREWNNCRFTAQLEQSLVLSLEDQARWMIGKMPGGGRTPAFLDYIDATGLKAVEPGAVRIVGR